MRPHNLIDNSAGFVPLFGKLQHNDNARQRQTKRSRTSNKLKPLDVFRALCANPVRREMRSEEVGVLHGIQRAGDVRRAKPKLHDLLRRSRRTAVARMGRSRQDKPSMRQGSGDPAHRLGLSRQPHRGTEAQAGSGLPQSVHPTAQEYQ